MPVISWFCLRKFIRFVMRPRCSTAITLSFDCAKRQSVTDKGQLGASEDDCALSRDVGRKVIVRGVVQGVGFRYTCKQVARGFEIVGWVRNLPDGRVELQCSGERNEVEDFLEAIIESELKSHIKGVSAIPIPPLAGTRGFEILS